MATPDHGEPVDVEALARKHRLDGLQAEELRREDFRLSQVRSVADLDEAQYRAAKGHPDLKAPMLELIQERRNRLVGEMGQALKQRRGGTR